MDPKRVRITGKAVSVRGNDIDTDRIIPARYLRCVTFDGLGEHAFEDDRAQIKASGGVHPLDDPRAADAEILLVNKNFGCGSSREHAPQSIMRWGKGIKALVGESFAEIFYGNCKALGIPAARVDADTVQALMEVNETSPEAELTLDLESCTLSVADKRYPLEIPDSIRTQFLEGTWDTMTELLEGGEAVASATESLPYWRHWQTA